MPVLAYPIGTEKTVSGIATATRSAYTGRRAEQEVSGTTIIVSRRFFGDSIVRAE